MGVHVRAARPGDGAGISRAWMSAAKFYADLDPDHFQVPTAHDLAESWDSELGHVEQGSLQLVAEVDDQVVGWLAARLEEPIANASAQLTREPGWIRLVITALVVQQENWRHGAGGALIDAAEIWGRSRGARVARLDTYIGSPVAVPFYEDRMGYERRSIVFQKQL
jgi:GNAT superfamily N-acetyltransferase